MAEWSFRRRQGWCGVCERRFDEGERHASTLTLRGEEIAREDVCASCFRAGARAEDLVWWMSRHRADKKRTLALDLEALERLFERLEGESATSARELRFVLCLLLMRKRRLKLERVLRSGEGEAMLVRKPRRRETSKVFVFDFAPERLEELRRQLEEAFEGVEPGEGGAGDASAAGASAAGESEGATADPADGLDAGAGPADLGGPEDLEREAAGDPARADEAWEASGSRPAR